MKQFYATVKMPQKIIDLNKGWDGKEETFIEDPNLDIIANMFILNGQQIKVVKIFEPFYDFKTAEYSLPWESRSGYYWKSEWLTDFIEITDWPD